MRREIDFSKNCGDGWQTYLLQSVQRAHFRERKENLNTTKALNVCFTKMPVVAWDRCNLY